MIEGSVTGDREVAAYLRGLPPRVRDQVRKSIGRQVILLQSSIVQRKLSGQVLKVRTGTLRRSIDQHVIDQDDGVVGVVFSNLKYARFHEYGFSGTENVRAHMRMMKQAFGRPVREPREIPVRAHPRTVNYPARSFMRTALAEMAPQIQAALRAAVGEGLH